MRHDDHADVSFLGFIAELVTLWLVVGALFTAVYLLGQPS